MGQYLGNLLVGSKVKLKENGTDKIFIVLGIDHYGSDTGVTLLRKDVSGRLIYNHGYRGESSSGCNVYMAGNLDNYCNVIFPNMLDDTMKNCIIQVPLIVMEGNNITTLHTIYRKGFSVSASECGDDEKGGIEGTAFPWLTTAANRVAYLDGTNVESPWWLRTTSTGGNTSACYIMGKGDGYGPAGDIRGNPVYASSVGPRPAFNLKSTITVSSTTDSDGCYTVESVPGANGALYVKNNGAWVQAV